MNNREKLLGAVVLVILVGLGARSVHNRLNTAYQQYVSQEDAKDDALFQEQLKVDRGLQAAARLAQWQERSLPSDANAANVLYFRWLRDQLEEAGLELVDPPKYTADAAAIDGFRNLRYDVTTTGSLAEITDFLYRFYRSNHLHKISKLELTPEDESANTIRVALSVEAWSLADADRVDTLTEGESDRLAHESLDEYRDSIDKRNIFAVYTPPRRPEGRRSPFDHAEHAEVNGIVESGGRPQVWINVRSSGEKHWLYEGESFHIGDHEFRIVEIGDRSVVLEAEGQRYSVRLGRNLREGQPVAAEQTAHTS
jgi:hypothetical protein